MKMGYDVNGKTCLVTGSAKGLGKEFAKRLLAKGAKVCISDLNDALGIQTANELKEVYGRENVTFFKLDVTDDDKWDHALDHCKQKFGCYVQVLVNNAGLLSANHQQVLDINIKATVMGALKVMEQMKRNDGGRIINIASMAGLINRMATFDSSSYHASKNGVVSFTREFKDIEDEKYWNMSNIKGYAICPWLVDTDMNSGKLGEKFEYFKRRYKRYKNTRILKIEEVGVALDQALQQDDNGAVYALIPDTPTIVFPEWNDALIYPMMCYAKFRHMISPSCNLVNVKDIVKISQLFYFLVGFASALTISNIIL